MITTETCVTTFGSVTLPVGHIENETRISLTVSEIFDRKQEPWTRCFFILIKPYEVVRLIWFCSSKFDVKIKNLEILDVGDYNISETMITTETCVTPFGSVTLPVGHTENETRISLTVSEIFDRKQEPWTRCFFILILIIKPYEVVRLIWFCSSKFDVKIENLEILDVSDNNISVTITTTETWVAPFGSVTLSVGHRENETRISLTVSEIFDRKQEPWTRCFFILIKQYEVDGLYDFARANFTSKSKILKFLMLATTISQKW